jgi:type II secretory pathway component PulM
MYVSLTPRWAIFLMGMVAAVLGVVPFVAYWKGPEIRARSKYSKILMAEERARVAAANREEQERAQEAGEEGYEVDSGAAGRTEKLGTASTADGGNHDASERIRTKYG